MALRFSPGDEDVFEAAKRGLVHEVENRMGLGAGSELLADLEMFLDWTFRYGHGQLDRYSVEDIHEYLLEWCPRKVVASAADRTSILGGVTAWIEHLVETDRWRGGPVEHVLTALDGIVPDFVEAMEDGSRFGMGKSILMGTPGGGPDLDLGDPSAMEALVEAFNSLSLEERLEISRGESGLEVDTDLFGGYDLPMTDLPNPERVRAQAAAAPLVTQIDSLREYLGRGLKLTATGNPKLVDARAMLAILETDDQWEQNFLGETRTPRSANELPHLLFLLAVATAAGALDDDGRTLVPSLSWDDLEERERCRRLLDAALDVGIVSRGQSFRYAQDRANVFDEVNALLDDSCVHILVPAYIAGEESVAVVVEQAISVVRAELQDRWPHFFEGSTIDTMVERDVNRVFETYVNLGMVELVDRVDRQELYGGGSYRTGGSVEITDLGRAVIEDFLVDLGYVTHHLEDLATVDAAQAVMMLATSETDPMIIWQNWRPDADPVDKFDALMDVLMTADSGPERLAAVALLEQAPQSVQRRVEAMADGPRAAYALMVLDPDRSPFAGVGVSDGEAVLSDGRPIAMAIQDLGPARSLAPLVDLLWLELHVDPDELLEHVVLLDMGAPDAGLESGAFSELLNDIWRVDLDETVDLLEFLGTAHPVKATAKLARKGLVKHRSAYPRRR